MYVILRKKVKATGILIDKSKRKIQKQCVHTHENFAASTLIHRRPQQLNISETSFRRVVHKGLGMMPYKVQLVQELRPIDHPMGFRFLSCIAIDL